MRGRSLRIVLMGATIAMIAIVAPEVRADAATAPACTTTAGVTVIVDFAGFHHGIARGCAGGRPATALAAMQAAGFETAGTTQYGDAFLCRIDDLPSPKTEACTATPPAKSSWSFYWARPTDAKWTYSRVGVLGYRPPPGTIVAFAFGDMAKPGVVPSAAIRVTGSSVTTTTAAPAAPTTAPPFPTAAPAVVTTVPPALATTIAPPTSAATTSTPRPTPERAATSTAAPTSTTGETTFEERRALAPISDSSDSGSPLAAIVGIALVLALGTGAAFAMRARRSRAT